MNCSACAGYVSEDEAERGEVAGDRRRITVFLCPPCFDDIVGDKEAKQLSFD